MLKKSIASGFLALGLLVTAAFALPNAAMQPTQDTAQVEIQGEVNAGPTCCMKRAYCCSVQRSCCRSQSTEPTGQ